MASVNTKLEYAVLVSHNKRHKTELAPTYESKVSSSAALYHNVAYDISQQSTMFKKWFKYCKVAQKNIHSSLILSLKNSATPNEVYLSTVTTTKTTGCKLL